MYKPLKVTAYPRSGIVTDGTLPIDGILYAVAMANAYGVLPLTSPGVMSDSPPVDLPIERRGNGDLWYYASSFAQWGEYTEGQEHWNKRFDQDKSHLIDFQGKRGKVIVEQGRYKAYRMPVFYRHALDVSWYMVADIDAIRYLLTKVTHIGKKTSQGWGRINYWTVEEWESDCSTYDRDGNLMRSIPDDSGILYGIRPSYWSRDNQTVCIIPGMSK